MYRACRGGLKAVEAVSFGILDLATDRKQGLLHGH